MLHERGEDLLEVERRRPPVHDRQQVDAEGVLERGVLVELVEDDVGVFAALELDDQADPLAVALVAEVGDAGDLVVVDEERDALLDDGLGDVVGDFGEDEVLPAAPHLLGVHPRPDDRPAPAGGVGVHDAPSPADERPRREVGPLDELHQLLRPRLRVVDEVDDGVGDLVHVVRGDGGRHADRDAHGAVAEQVREFPGQHHRLGGGLVEVGTEIDRVEGEVFEHVDGFAHHAGLGVTHGGGRVPVDGPEVPLLLDEGISEREILRHADERGIDDLLGAVGVVVAEGVAGDLGALAEFRARPQAKVVHRDEDATLRGLEPVADVRERAVHDHAHREVQERVLQFGLNVEVPDVLMLNRHNKPPINKA